jgi:protein-L-isoaspartate(D-aspartate) O-methyltransferase
VTAEDYRRFYSEEIKFTANISSPALIEAFARVPREKFLGPGPWRIASAEQRALATTGLFEVTYVPIDDPRHVYHDVLIALDETRNLNNGQPSL